VRRGVTWRAAGSGHESAIAQAVSLIHTTRFLPPDVVVMHPRRWGWLLAQFDLQGRPLFLPNANSPMNAAGIEDVPIASQGVVGQVQGLPIVVDPLVTTTAGSESPVGTEDQIIVMRSQDAILFESGIRARVLPETKASSLTILLQVYSYLAVTFGRYPQSFCVISGLTAPTW
jgi:hypothetical protein